MEFKHWPPKAGENPFQLMGGLKMRMFRVVKCHCEKAGLDLGVEEIVTMIHIRQADGMHQSQLAEFIGRDRPSITRVLDVLEGKGWIRRSVDPRDRRSHCLTLTEEGSDVLEEAQPLVREIVSRVFEPIPDADYEVFLSVLRTLQHQLNMLTEHGATR